MIRVRIKIGQGEIVDTYDKYGFVYMDADERTASDLQDYTKTKYVEDATEHTDNRTIETAFDYKVKFLVEAVCGNTSSVNNKIDEFNKKLFVRTDDGVLHAQVVEFYNDYNRVKIVGYPKLISEPTEAYYTGVHGGSDWAICELTIRVTDPTLCEFATERYVGNLDKVLYNDTDAHNGNISTSGTIENYNTMRYMVIPVRKGEVVEGETRAYGNAAHWVAKDSKGNVLAYKQPRTDVKEPFVYLSQSDDVVYLYVNMRTSALQECYAVLYRNTNEIQYDYLDCIPGVMQSNGVVYSHDYLRYITIPVVRGDKLTGKLRAYGNAPYWVLKDASGKVIDYQAGEEGDFNLIYEVGLYGDIATDEVEYFTINFRDGATDIYATLKHSTIKTLSDADQSDTNN